MGGGGGADGWEAVSCATVVDFGPTAERKQDQNEHILRDKLSQLS